jgi:peptide-methionine (S)-S-oxide reductase
MSSNAARGREVATLAGGCFWCLEAVFLGLQGVERVVSGYMGGHVPNPTYRDVCEGDTGHAEVVQIEFDPAVLSYRDLLEVFFAIHDPTTLNRQGNDIGTQYRSGIYWHTPAQEAVAQAVRAELNAQLQGRVVTEIQAERNYSAAEAYHQHYFARHPQQGYCALVIAPKVEKFRKTFRDRVRPAP